MSDDELADQIEFQQSLQPHLIAEYNKLQTCWAQLNADEQGRQLLKDLGVAPRETTIVDLLESYAGKDVLTLVENYAVAYDGWLLLASMLLETEFQFAEPRDVCNYEAGYSRFQEKLQRTKFLFSAFREVLRLDQRRASKVASELLFNKAQKEAESDTQVGHRQLVGREWEREAIREFENSHVNLEDIIEERIAWHSSLRQDELFTDSKWFLLIDRISLIHPELHGGESVWVTWIRKKALEHKKVTAISLAEWLTPGLDGLPADSLSLSGHKNHLINWNYLYDDIAFFVKENRSFTRHDIIAAVFGDLDPQIAKRMATTLLQNLKYRSDRLMRARNCHDGDMPFPEGRKRGQCQCQVAWIPGNNVRQWNLDRRRRVDSIRGVPEGTQTSGELGEWGPDKVHWDEKDLRDGEPPGRIQ